VFHILQPYNAIILIIGPIQIRNSTAKVS
jgi:hypothetical protein